MKENLMSSLTSDKRNPTSCFRPWQGGLGVGEYLKNIFFHMWSMWIIHTKIYVTSFDKDTKEKERKPH